MSEVRAQKPKFFFTGINSGVSKVYSGFTGLAAIAESLGYSVCTSLEEGPDLLVCVDFKQRFRRVVRKGRKLGLPTFLVKHEPPSIVPEHRKENPGKLFDVVLTRGVSHNTPIINIGVAWDTRFTMNSARGERVVAIAADKWSFYPDELYSLRRQAYSSDSRIDLFGYGWGESNLRRILRLIKEIVIVIRSGIVPKLRNIAVAFNSPINYRGPIEDKHALLSSYKVALVIENDASAMSEKIVDCILAGTIPVYVGPPVSQFGIPDHLAVQSGHQLESIVESIDYALDLDSLDFQRKALEWACLDHSKSNWDSQAIGERLIRDLVKSARLQT